jgi:3-oxoacyl-[acyl-carrier protein] reductase
MTDSYLAFANSAIGARLAAALGLPRPVPLERFTAHHPVLQGDVLIAAGPSPHLLPALVQASQVLQLNTVSHQLPAWTAMCNQAGMMTGRWGVGEQPGAPIKALVYDATGLNRIEQADHLYHCLQDTVRSLLPSGRVLLLARSPQACNDVQQATVQRALEGLMRSLAKEVKRGIAVQLIQVDEGAETSLTGCLQFFLSPRSAYVSGQVIRWQRPSTIAPVSLPVQWTTDVNQPLAGRRLLVTGASRGIGAAIAQTLARDGARVVCLDVPSSAAALQTVAEQVGGWALPLDITDPQAAQTLVDRARSDGGWDGVVHNAGITRDKTIARMPEHAWRSVTTVNLLSPAVITQTLLDAQVLAADARVVCVSSISGIAGNVGQTNYAFSKAGVIGLVQSLAPAFAARGMAINAVAPGFIETQMTAAIPFAIREAGRRMNAMGQGGLPVDVAETIAWLMSPLSRGVNGQVIRVCGQSWLGA